VADVRVGHPGADLTQLAVGALKLAALPFALFAVGIGVAIVARSPIVLALSTVASFVTGSCAIVLAVKAAWSLARIPITLRPRGLGHAIAAIPIAIVGSFMGALGVAALVQFSRGRQLRRFGCLTFAPLSKASAWLEKRDDVIAPIAPIAPPPDGVADAWRTNGLTEHASVASFARLSIELVALGAPRGLIEAAHRDAMDEMRHTDLCFDLARSLDGRAIGPGEVEGGPMLGGLLPRRLRIARLAVDSMIDGALNEGVSARVIAELAEKAEHGRVKETLMQIARDEARHAAHGFEVVRWCASAGGPLVRSALASAASLLPKALGDGLSPEAADGRWERWGIPGRDRETRAHAAVRARVLARIDRMLSAPVLPS
jgi:hypothetical protein